MNIISEIRRRVSFQFPGNHLQSEQLKTVRESTPKTQKHKINKISDTLNQRQENWFENLDLKVFKRKNNSKVQILIFFKVVFLYF